MEGQRGNAPKNLIAKIHARLPGAKHLGTFQRLDNKNITSWNIMRK